MNALVEAARRYKGVARFRHRGRSAGFLDCAGLGHRIYKDCGIELPDVRLYGPEPHKDGLIQHMTAALGEPAHVAPVRREWLQIGDIVAFRFNVEPHHVGLISDYPTGGLAFIDADGMEGQVVERRLSDKYLAKITHVFRKPV